MYYLLEMLTLLFLLYWIHSLACTSHQKEKLTKFSHLYKCILISIIYLIGNAITTINAQACVIPRKESLPILTLDLDTDRNGEGYDTPIL